MTSTRTSPPDDADTTRVWRFANAEFDEAALVLTVAGQPMAMEHRPLELLRLLLHHAGEVVTKDEIFEAVWPGRVVTESSLTKCAGRLRLALGDTEQTMIRTAHGYGYRLAAEVSVRCATRTEATQRVEPAFAAGDAVPHRPQWRLSVRLHGGGFGEVWLGEHTKTHEQRVFKFGRDGAQLTALKREITLFRLLNDALGRREDYARILEWNLEEPPYFIEVELSSEGNLQQWAKKRGGLTTLSLSKRLELAAQIADALAAAHSVGVLHKDLKPANVLVWLDADEVARIRLTDFGSGQVLDAARLERLGITRLGFTQAQADDDSSSGTPLYLAPELLAGQPPTVQADIYALGVMLYQLIVGDFKRQLAPGWEAGVADELLREDISIAAAGDPLMRLADISQLAARLRGLDARRAQRGHERQSEARNQRLEQSLIRARARRRWLRALAATFLVGFAISTWLYFRAEAASRRAATEAATARAVTDFLTRNLLSAANPLISADPNIRVRELLGPAAAELDRRFAADSLPRAAIEDAIGQAYTGLSEPKRALPLLESALAVRRKMLGDADPQTQATRLQLIHLHELHEDLPTMKILAQQVLDFGKAGGTLNAGTELEARQALLFADCLARKIEEACLKPERAFLDELRARLGPKHELSLSTENDLAFDLAEAQHFDEAVPMAREVLALTTEVFGTKHLMTAARERRLGSVLNMAGHYDEAIAVLTEARQDLLAIGGRETQYSVTAANDLAYSYLQTQRYAEALPLFRLGLDYQRQNDPVESPNLTLSLNNTAMTLARLKRFDEAVTLQREAVAIDARLVGSDHPDALTHAMNLAGFEDGAGASEHSERIARDTLTRARRQFTHGEWDLGWYVFKTGALLAAHGKKAEARELLSESLANFTTALGPDNENTRKARAAIAAL